MVDRQQEIQMSRTLRGFEEQFPYLGGRGDVSDAGIISKEEAYGAHFGAIGDQVVNEMFGATPEPWCEPGMLGIPDCRPREERMARLATMKGRGPTRAPTRTSHHSRYGGVSDQVVNEMFGYGSGAYSRLERIPVSATEAQALPSGFVSGRSRGVQREGTKATARGPAPAASAFAGKVMAHLGISPSMSTPHWVSGNTLVVGPASSNKHLDNAAADAGRTHGAYVLKAQHKAHGIRYVFTDSPVSTATTGALYGWTMKPLRLI
jgi:hypothetical protein